VEGGDVQDDPITAANADLAREVVALLPTDADVIDCHTHLGVDEDGQSLNLAALLGFLDDIGPAARACAFPLHDPERRPAYRVPNDRVLAWAAESGGRVIPYCRLDPADGPIEEAERCLGLGARGLKLHPRAQSFGFGTPVMASIFAVARDAGVPILIHAGRGMPPMNALADLALSHPEVPLVLAHAAIAGQGMFASRLADHPAVLYDTSCFSPYDVLELFARVPVERIVFASDAPYGRPASGLYHALRVAALAGLDDEDRRRLVGGTMATVLDGRPLPPTTPPRLAVQRPVDGRLLRLGAYLTMGFGALFGAREAGGAFELERILPGVALARCVCRDPESDAAGAALARIDAILLAVEQLAVLPPPRSLAAIGLLQGASIIAATEVTG
jgi:uncharacterized protein